MSNDLISRIENQIRETLRSQNIRFNIEQELMIDGIDQDICIRLSAESIATEQLHMNESAGNMAILGAVANWAQASTAAASDYFESIPACPSGNAKDQLQSTGIVSGKMAIRVRLTADGNSVIKAGAIGLLEPIELSINGDIICANFWPEGSNGCGGVLRPQFEAVGMEA